MKNIISYLSKERFERDFLLKSRSFYKEFSKFFSQKYPELAISRDLEFDIIKLGVNINQIIYLGDYYENDSDQKTFEKQKYLINFLKNLQDVPDKDQSFFSQIELSEINCLRFRDSFLSVFYAIHLGELYNQTGFLPEKAMKILKLDVQDVSSEYITNLFSFFRELAIESTHFFTTLALENIEKLCPPIKNIEEQENFFSRVRFDVAKDSQQLEERRDDVSASLRPK